MNAHVPADLGGTINRTSPVRPSTRTESEGSAGSAEAKRDDNGVREQRARDWERTAFVAWGGAIAVAAWTKLTSGAHTGDVALSLYFALLGSALWIQAVRVRFAGNAPRFTLNLANVLTAAFALALLFRAG